MPYRVGCDVMSVAEVKDSIAILGERYLERVYTPHELSSSAGSDQASRLAARFAAKEAVLKVLRVTGPMPWRDIQICRVSDGSCRVELAGYALAAAEQIGMSEIEISISHHGDVAMAVALGEFRRLGD
ncbi:MAG: holo-ACP synthase [Nocardiaceae bacterium]|nr:holo-ACP synthase [Nocardiaceae bacterium]